MEVGVQGTDARVRLEIPCHQSLEYFSVEEVFVLWKETGVGIWKIFDCLVTESLTSWSQNCPKYAILERKFG